MARYFAAWLDKLSLAVPSAPIVLHNSDHLISNLWGALGSVERDLKGIREDVFK